MYLNDDFFNWPYSDYESTGVDFDKLTRAHDMWRHAQSRVKGEPNEFDRVDCISSLKRAVNSRLKTIESVYNFDKLPSLRSKKQTLEKYQDYGLIRPSILRDLFEIRNLLEHEDVDPPETDKCHLFIDIVWYFLKSTDSLLQMKCDCLIYESDTSELFMRPDSEWSYSLSGKVEKHLVSDTPKTNFIELVDGKTSDFLGNSAMLNISGSVKMTEELKTRFARDYFGAMDYWFEDHA